MKRDVRVGDIYLILQRYFRVTRIVGQTAHWICLDDDGRGTSRVQWFEDAQLVSRGKKPG